MTDTDNRATRGTGKTLAMVRALTGEPAIYVVHNLGLRKYVQDMIRDTHSEEIAKMVRVEVISGPSDIDRLRGRQEEIFVDHAAWDAWTNDGVMDRHDIQKLMRVLVNRLGREAAQ